MKRIISSSLLTFAALAVIVGGTSAFFSDTETAEGNVFTAGSIDLMINHTAATYNGFNCESCGVELYSGDGQNDVVDGTNAEKTGFPFAAELVADPHNNWDTHTTADWIWASDTTLVGDDGSDGGDTTYVFERTFQWNGTTGSIDFNLDVGADNEYVVYLNGTEVGSGDGYSTIDSTLFSDNLQNGENTLTFEVTNNYNENFPNSNTPEANPGGLLYYISIEREDCSIEDLPDYMAEYQAFCELWESKDLTNESFFDFSDVKPQDEGTNRISMTVEDNESYICLAVENKENNEHDLNGAEDNAGDTTPNVGELGDFLQVMGWYADANGGTNGTAFGPTAANDLDTITYADSNTGNPVAPGDTQYLETAWCLGELTDDGNGNYTCDGNVVDINQTQTDEFTADLQFHAVQTRNNEGFTCEGYLAGDSDDSSGDEIGCTEEADVMLVLDSSGSIGSDMSTLKTAAKGFVDTLNPSTGGVEVGIVDFDGNANTIQGLTGSSTAAKDAIDTLNDGGSTRLDLGLREAETELNDNGRSGVPQFILVVNDGNTSNTSGATDAANDLKADDVTIFAVGIGSSLDASFLEDNIVTQPSDEHYFHADNFEDIETEFADILSCEPVN